MRRNKNHIEINMPEPKEEPVKKVFWTNSKKLILIAIVTSWVPFHGYMYLNALLSGVGFESVYVSIDAWEAVYYFLISIKDIWVFLSIADIDYTACQVFIALFVFILLVVCFYNADRIERLALKFTNKVESSKDRKLYKLVWSIGAAISCFAFPFLVLVLLVLIPAFIFLLAVLGNALGLNDGRDVLLEKKCIYAMGDSDCAYISIGKSERRLSGYIVHQNDKHTFLIANDGLYYLNSKGRVLQHKPFIASHKYHPKKEPDLDSEIWNSNISLRRSLLESFIDNPKYKLTRNIVLQYLGEPDSKLEFHYSEFPVYKLSEKTNCRVAFPYNWKTENIVNVVFLGDCSGVSKQ